MVSQTLGTTYEAPERAQETGQGIWKHWWALLAAVLRIATTERAQWYALHVKVLAIGALSFAAVVW
jgi:hypothetical protein